MKLLSRVAAPSTLGPDAVRLAVCLIAFTHGGYRIWSGETRGLGGLLAELHFPAPLLLAWFVSLAETVGALLLALRLAVLPVTLTLASIYLTGIVLFNARRGFFLVGAGEGGWEYNFLLVVCLLATAWQHRRQPLA